MPWKPKSAEDIVHKWDKHVAKRFDDFLTVLKKRPVKIPDKYLEENSIENNGKLYRNFLELFLRYDTAKAIADIITGLSEDERTNLTEDVIHPYWVKWDKLLNSIGTIFGQTKDVLDVTSNFHTLKNWCGDFDSGSAIFDEEVRHYEMSFDKFCKAFALLPRRASGSFAIPPRNQLAYSTGAIAKLSPHARKVLDLKKCDLGKRIIQLNGVATPFSLTANMAWDTVVKLLSSPDKDGWAKLDPKWQTHFGSSQYRDFKEYIHPQIPAFTGMNNPRRRGNRTFRLQSTPRPIPQ